MGDPDPVDTMVEDLPVKFMPPLAHERQRWILDTLRTNRARSVLDIGCGEGALLSVLSNPASSIPNDAKDKHLSTPIRDLHLTRVAALDIDPAVIEDAVHAATYKRSPHYVAPWGSGEDGWYTRWAPLDVAVWLGQLQVLNPTFYGFDAIVSTEVQVPSLPVIEHVPDSVLPAFSYVLLGHYRPRLLLLTTPNFTFNARFHPPGVPRKGFLDPTGQTTRVFRHSDHKREWTVPEFEAWCREAADTHGYDVTLGGVGLPTEPDPFKRELGHASQTALFVRREELSLDTLSISTVYAPQDEPLHQLQVERAFEADSRAGCPESPRVIRDTAAWVMNMHGEGELTVSELWSELAMPCGGSVAALVNALMEEPEGERANESAEGDEDTIGQWSIQQPRNPNTFTDPRWDRVIVWKQFVPEPLPGEDQDDEYEYRDYGSGDQHWDVEAALDHANEWGADTGSVVHEGVNGWGATGWGQGGNPNGWGDLEIDAAAVWGPVDPEKPARH